MPDDRPLPHQFDAATKDLTRAVQALPRDPTTPQDFERVEHLVEWISGAAITLKEGTPHPQVELPIGPSYPGTRTDVIRALAAITALVPPPQDAGPEHYAQIRDWAGWLWHATRNVGHRVKDASW
ncbi:hypothetical protein [Streptomyces alfalfae]|uniref:Uncharacterized protein n=1 Tax=Streptomyces alfalfae TaxID=1642299 RepID=A0A7T4PGZ5_9ACTN|nr:hypothetical protein [Streptomyces alfalfae]QQC89844.1 hypothetical protein I8755_16555 [Streptomyces alfalfae]